MHQVWLSDEHLVERALPVAVTWSSWCNGKSLFAAETAGNGLVSGHQGVTLLLCAADSALSMGVQGGTAHPIPATLECIGSKTQTALKL